MQFKILPLLILTLALTRCQPRIQPITCADCDSFRCKIDGEAFSANAPWKSTPLSASTKDGGKHLVVYGRNSGKIVGIEMKSNIPIDTGAYSLTSWPVSIGIYSPNANSTFRTGPNHKGSLKIISLREVINGVSQPVIKGTFSFMGYDSLSRQQVAITDGEFRIRYLIY